MGFRNLMAQAGKWTLFVVILLIFGERYQVVNVAGFPIPRFVDALYFYLLVNGLAAGPFIYLERRARVAVRKACPKCDGPLESIVEYSCPTCGRLRFGP